MDKLVGFLSGKKSYIIAGLAVTGAVLLKYGIVTEIPAWLYLVLGAAGLGAVRAAITKIQAALNEAEGDEE